MDEQILQIKNSDTFKRLLKIVSENVGSITELITNDKEITVRKKNETLFKHQPLPGKIFSINEQKFIYESVKSYFDSRYNFFANFYNENSESMWLNPHSEITIKGLSSW